MEKHYIYLSIFQRVFGHPRTRVTLSTDIPTF
jgi:hypothetical protein